MEKIRVAVVGYGNIGRCGVEAVEAAPDMELAGVVRRSAAGPAVSALAGVPVAERIADLGRVDVALLCTPTVCVEETGVRLLEAGISTVDSYDIHSGICDLRTRFDRAAKQGGAAAIVAAGWDPGSDSVVRTLLEAMAPCGITYTDFGPGMSMGHSVAARAVAGVQDAMSLTVPLGTGIHRRMVYVELQPGAALEDVRAAICQDPYFCKDETHVIAVPDVGAVLDTGHGVHMERKGVSGTTANQRFVYEMSINNPALTSQILVAAARAVRRREPGAYTLIEIPPIDLLPGGREDLIRRLV